MDKFTTNTSRLTVVYRPTADLLPYVGNSNFHSDEQVRQIAASMTQFGFTNPLLIDEHGVIIAGHGRLMAANLLGIAEVPTITLGHLNETQRRAYVIADNQLAKNSTWDMDALAAELALLADTDFDLTLTGFTFDDLDTILRGDDFLPANSAAQPYQTISQKLPDKYAPADGSRPLLRKFGAPPFSILDCRQGYWQSRKREWLTLVGDTSATKEGTLAQGNIMEHINSGSSGFDPVLAELMYLWFCPTGGHVLDPFGGEQTKGFVAGYLGLRYSAIEFRQDQIDHNRTVCSGMAGVKYVQGDSNYLGKLIKDTNFDFIFTSPPYYDLEVYSTDDMSALGTYEEFMQQYDNIFRQAVAKLADNRFLVIKVGEIRDRKTGIYRNFVGHNVALFTSLGLHYYNDIAMVNPVGTAAIRANRTFATRKLVRVHQTVLVFYKGDVDRIGAHFPDVDYDENLLGTDSE